MPLYSDVLEVAVLWNAKAACTFAIKWLFYHEGILEEAEAFAPWIHQYRQQVFYRRPGYSDKLQRIPKLGWRAVKFVRNPFDRAVSSYLSFAHQAHSLTSDQHKPMLREIGRHLRRPIGDAELFSFREFVSYLASVDLDRANIHVRRQTHECERLVALPELTVIRIEEVAEVLPQIEERLGLSQSNIERLSSSRHHTTRVPQAVFAGDMRFGKVSGTPIPTTGAFYDGPLRESIGRLYATDLRTYGYEGPR